MTKDTTEPQLADWAKAARDEELKKRDKPINYTSLAIPPPHLNPLFTSLKPSAESTTEETLIRQSTGGYILFAVDDHSLTASAPSAYTDLVSGPTIITIVTKAEDFRNAEVTGQDAVGIRKSGNMISITTADGVGQSYFGDIAARNACLSTIQDDSNDLNERLNHAAATLQQAHSSLPVVTTGQELLDNALAENRGYGSETTLNQYAIDCSSGRVKGLLFGNGGFSIIKLNGEAEHYSSGTDAGRISTRYGRSQVTPKTIEEIVGEEVVLGRGDRLFCYSDGMTPDILEKLIKAHQENLGNSDIAQIVENGPHNKAQVDDRTLVDYLQV